MMLNLSFLTIATSVRLMETRLRRKGVIDLEMFSVEGFIHCSTPAQVLQVANARFRGQSDLLLLSIETDRVGPEIRYENLEGGEQLFPHVYGELNTDAVVRVAEFRPESDGSFKMP